MYISFFKCYGDPRHLHSFPTRRSSDLRVDRGDGHQPCAVWHGKSTGTAAPRSWRSGSRSEEHTSELQSLRHLVCRLLLEKKNKNNHTLADTILYNWYAH